MRALTVCVVTLGLVCSVVAAACGADWLVKADGTGDFPTIQSAIDNAESGDTILLEMATFTGPGNVGVDFKGKAVTVTGLGGPGDTIIDCANLDRGFRFVSGEPAGAALRNLTIRNGVALTEDDDLGGGIFIEGASPVLTDIRVENCTAVDGGGIHIAGASAAPRIEDSVIHSCDATGTAFEQGGGGVSVSRAAPTIVRSEIHNNEAANGAGMSLIGEGLLPVAGSYTDLLVHSNIAQGAGGGIKVVLGGADLVLSHNAIWGNSAEKGGGVYVLTTSDGATIRRITVIQNMATVTGAGLYFGGTPGAKVRESIVAYNTGVAENSIRCTAATGVVECSLIWNPLSNDQNICQYKDNVVAHPQFCGVLGSGNITLQSDSAANASNNACGVIMGAGDVGCSRTAITSVSWGNLKRLYR